MNHAATAATAETMPIPPFDFADGMAESFSDIQRKVQGVSHLLEPYAQGAPFTSQTAKAFQGCLDSLAGEIEEYSEIAFHQTVTEAQR